MNYTRTSLRSSIGYSMPTKKDKQNNITLGNTIDNQITKYIVTPDSLELTISKKVLTYFNNDKKKQIFYLIDKNLESKSIFSSTTIKDISTFKTTSIPPTPGSRFQKPIIHYDEFFSKLKEQKRWKQ